MISRASASSFRSETVSLLFFLFLITLTFLF
jgi:hypothetical protein